MIVVGKKYTIRDKREAMLTLREEWPDTEQDEDGYTDEENFFLPSKEFTITEFHKVDAEEFRVEFMNEKEYRYHNHYSKKWIEAFLEEVSSYIQEEMEI